MVTNSSANDTVQLVATSASGTCFYLEDVQVTNPGRGDGGHDLLHRSGRRPIPLVGNAAWTTHW